MKAELADGNLHTVDGCVYVLRNVKADMTSYEGFRWPRRGWEEAPDWEPTYTCGNGLHGLPWARGSAAYFQSDPHAVWLVVKVRIEDGFLYGQGDLCDKCKFRRGYVVFAGSEPDALDYIVARGADRTNCYRATSGEWGQSTSGYRGQSTSGHGGQSTSGYRGQSMSGEGGQSTSGDGGQSTSGYQGQSTSGYGGQSTSGDRGQSMSGYRGQSMSGKYGLAVSQGGRVRVGQGGVAVLYWFDEDGAHILSGVAGQDIQADRWYEQKNGQWTEVTEEQP